MQNARLIEAQAGIKTVRRNINNFRYADDTTLRAESEKELKNLLMKVKEESEKAGLKLNIQKTGPITSWQIDGKKMETGRFYFLGLQKSLWTVIEAIKLKTLAPWDKSYDKTRQHIKKQRYHFANKCPSSQNYGFSSSHVWMRSTPLQYSCLENPTDRGAW